jgi:hypothetical protein
LVLDVEQGAVIYYRLGVGDYLIGVTLNQERVGAADGKLASLATALGQREPNRSGHQRRLLATGDRMLEDPPEGGVDAQLDC